ncbi:N,N-dimethylformamidase beta subunit family domain-containing protein [Streptomyces sp. NPDC000410]|uniref:N,N-dimethylformamidase beta subunit family domain-containing protein n=1 Tax=Streptomyces sp. NPDC000410 TaxID=3154254 RepID=UPI0033189368
MGAGDCELSGGRRTKPPRRAVLGLIGAGTVGMAAQAFRGRPAPGGKEVEASRALPRPVEPVVLAPSRSIAEENRREGSKGWISRSDIPMASSDRRGDIMGYASATSVGHGGIVDFHVSVHSPQNFRIAVFRIGDYAGRGARLYATSGRLQGGNHLMPRFDPVTGTIACAWPVSWRLRIPEGWMSGLYQAVFTADDGYRSSTPFVVRAPERASDILVVLPFATYQAYNMWPEDGRTGRNLYRGYQDHGKLGGADERAYKVSFDRPYPGAGVPTWFSMDTSFIRWAERAGHDVTYASSIDLHDGTVDTANHRAIFFPGHDEYWSKPMRDAAEQAVGAGKHLAFLASNNVYFQVRMERSDDGRANRVMACYKSAHDPAGASLGRTSRWRDISPDGRYAEQRLLGIQFNGIVRKPAPMVVRDSGHWLWAGTGLRWGDKLPRMVGGEADGFDPSAPGPPGARRTLLTESPYHDRRSAKTTKVQHTALTEFPSGGMVFVAGTFHWALALDDPDHVNSRIRQATTNLISHLLAQPKWSAK